MSGAAKNRSSTGRRARLGGREGNYAELVEAHETACKLGQPLLTEAGLSWLDCRQRLMGERDHRSPGRPSGNSLQPRWDAAARKLWLGNVLIKTFRQRAPRQTALLDVFEEEGWIAHIDDPIPRAAGEGDEEAGRRLHDAIKNLNQSLLRGTIRFRGDGTGQGVIWEYASPEVGEDRQPK